MLDKYTNSFNFFHVGPTVSLQNLPLIAPPAFTAMFFIRYIYDIPAAYAALWLDDRRRYKNGEFKEANFCVLYTNKNVVVVCVCLKKSVFKEQN